MHSSIVFKYYVPIYNTEERRQEDTIDKMKIYTNKKIIEEAGMAGTARKQKRLKSQKKNNNKKVLKVGISTTLQEQKK